jgi:hypothetical protein
MLITPRTFFTMRPIVSFETITKLRGAQFCQNRQVDSDVRIVDDRASIRIRRARLLTAVSKADKTKENQICDSDMRWYSSGR